MMKRNRRVMIGGGVVAIVATIASCSFPTYDITVTGGSADATTAATGSSGSAGGSGGASATASSGSGGASASSGTSASTSSTSTSTSASTTSSSASTSATTGSGPCSTDADGDTYISAKCPGGNDCADGDALANPKGDFHTFPITNPPPGTLPFDFNCSGSEEAETPKLTCGGDCSSVGFNSVVACGASAPLGKCAGIAPLCGFMEISPAVSKTQRCK
ncbi:MAG: hypothetical protein ABJE95_31155 [Byssovorax sp.]